MDKDVMKAITDHVNDRASHLIDVFIRTPDVVFDDDTSKGLAAIFATLAESFRTEADLWAASRKKGWQSTATRLREAAKLVQEVGEAVAKLAAGTSTPGVDVQPNPHRPPLEAGARAGDGFVYRANIGGGPVPDAPNNTLAYLRGDIDTLPTDLKPLPEETPAKLLDSPDINEEARQMTQTFPIDPSAMTGIVNGPNGALPDGEFTDPKPITALMRSSYVPPNGNITLPTFADLLIPPPANRIPDHWSWSQVETSESCGLRYRLSRIDGYTQIPQWSNIGGDAFHKAAEHIDRTAAVGNPYPSHDGSVVGTVWDDYFSQAVADVASTSSVPIGKWRVAAGGKENQDWWRVEGERMLRTFVEQRAKLAASASPRKLATLPGPTGMVPAVEWPFTITVDGPLGPLTFTNIIDRVWECADGTLLIEDLKSGSRMPKDTGQLGSYAWGVALSGAMGITARIIGAFYDARKGVWTPAVNLLTAHPWEEFVYRLHSAEAKRRAGLYTPHVTDLCVACPVQYACPLMNRAGQQGGTS